MAAKCLALLGTLQKTLLIRHARCQYHSLETAANVHTQLSPPPSLPSPPLPLSPLPPSLSLSLPLPLSLCLLLDGSLFGKKLRSRRAEPQGSSAQDKKKPEFQGFKLRKTLSHEQGKSPQGGEGSGYNFGVKLRVSAMWEREECWGVGALCTLPDTTAQ